MYGWSPAAELIVYGPNRLCTEKPDATNTIQRSTYVLIARRSPSAAAALTIDPFFSADTHPFPMLPWFANVGLRGGGAEGGWGYDCHVTNSGFDAPTDTRYFVTGVLPRRSSSQEKSIDYQQCHSKIHFTERNSKMPNDKDGPIIRPDENPKPRFLRSSLADVAFYREHEAEILAAARDGRVIDDVTATKPKWGKDFGRVG